MDVRTDWGAYRDKLVRLTDFVVDVDSLEVAADPLTGRLCAWARMVPTQSSFLNHPRADRSDPLLPSMILRMDCFQTRGQIEAFLNSPNVVGSVTQADELSNDAARFALTDKQIARDLKTALIITDYAPVFELNRMPLPEELVSQRKAKRREATRVKTQKAMASLRAQQEAFAKANEERRRADEEARQKRLAAEQAQREQEARQQEAGPVRAGGRAL
jgi:hypothetical protein